MGTTKRVTTKMDTAKMGITKRVTIKTGTTKMGRIIVVFILMEFTLIQK